MIKKNLFLGLSLMFVFVLFSGAVLAISEITVSNGELFILIFNGKNYKIKPSIYSPSKEVIFTVTYDGTTETTDALTEYQTDTLADGTEIYVKNIFISSQESVPHSVTFQLREEVTITISNEEIKIRPATTSRIEAILPLYSGSVTIPTHYFYNSAWHLGRDADDRLITNEIEDGYDATIDFGSTDTDKDDYFVITNAGKCESYLMRVNNVDESNNELTFKNLATGEKTSVIYIDGTTGTFTVGSLKIKFKYTELSDRLQIDLDNSGAFDDNYRVPFYTKSCIPIYLWKSWESNANPGNGVAYWNKVTVDSKGNKIPVYESSDSGVGSVKINPGFTIIEEQRYDFVSIKSIGGEASVDQPVYISKEDIDVTTTTTVKTTTTTVSPSCSDTDWFGSGSLQHLARLSTKGTCTDDSGSHTDYCYSDNALRDYTCEPLMEEPKHCSYVTYQCRSYGFDGCQDGACIHENQTTTTTTNTTTSTTTTIEQEIGYDVCNNGIGWSLPKGAAMKCGWPPGAKGYIKDCCCCYLDSHIHDLGKTFSNTNVKIEYRPGWARGCTSPMQVYYSINGEDWNMFYHTNVTQETWSPKTTYTKILSVPGDFRYIKIHIPRCYNDYSSARATNITITPEEEEETVTTIIETTIPGEEKPVTVCDGCVYKTRCVAYGTRIIENGVPSYCSIDGSFLVQKEDGSYCLNNYECESNFCSENECYNIKEEIRETRSLLEQIIDFLRSWFGIK